MSALDIEINPAHICIIKGGLTKHQALEQLILAMGQSPKITDCEAFRRAVHEREAIMSTGIGGGIAIPHVRIPEVSAPLIGVGVAPKGLEFGTLDNNPVYIVVLFATPEGSDKEYLSLLAQVMVAMKNQELFDQLIACRKPSAVYALLNG